MLYSPKYHKMITITNEAKFHGIEVKAHKLGLLLLYNNYYVNKKKKTIYILRFCHSCLLLLPLHHCYQYRDLHDQQKCTEKINVFFLPFLFIFYSFGYEYTNYVQT